MNYPAWTVAFAGVFHELTAFDRLFCRITTSNIGWQVFLRAGGVFSLQTHNGVNSSYQDTTAAAIAIDLPYVIVFKQTSTTVKWHVNGVDVTDTPVSMYTPGTATELMTFFAQPGVWDRNLAMTLHWVAAFDRYLSDDESIALYDTFNFKYP